jgi:WD40 repeat protein
MSQLALHWFVLAVDASLKILVVAAAVAAGLWMLRVRNSSARHIAWLSVLLAMVALPFLAGVLPSLRLPAPGFLSVVALQKKPTQVPKAEQARFDVPPSIAVREPARPFAVRGETNVGVPSDSASFEHAPFDTATDHATLSQPGPANHREGRPGNADTAGATVDRSDPSAHAFAVLDSARNSWLLVLASAWLVIAGTLFCRQILAMSVTWRLVARSIQISLPFGADRAAGGVVGSLPVRESSDILIPLTVRIVRPVVLLPADWRTWSREKLSNVLNHEQIHAERRDCLTRLVAEMATCVYWFHPIAWWLRGKLAALAEEVCDDAVIDSTGDRTAYARHILEFATLLSTGTHHVVYSGLSMARESKVESRINAILNLSRPLSRRLTWTTAIVIPVVILPLVGVAAALRPSIASPRTSESATIPSLAEAAAFVSNALALGPRADTARTSEGLSGKAFQPSRIRTFAVPGQVGSLAFDSNGGKLVTVGWRPPDKDSMQSWTKGTNPGDIRIWDRASGNVIAQFGESVGGMFDVAVSPDDKMIVTAGRVLNSPNLGAVVIWDVKTGKPIRTLEGQTPNAQTPTGKNQAWSLSVAYSPDGKLIAAGGFDRRVKVWEAASGKPVTVLRYFKMLPRSVSFSADGKTLVTGYEAGSVVLWEVGTWARRGVFNTKDVILMSADLSDDGKHLVAAGPERVPSSMGQGGRIHLWDVASGREEEPIRTETSAGGVAFSPSGRHFAASANRTKIWASDRGEEVGEFQRRGSTSNDKIRFSPDGKTIAVAGLADVTLWDVSGLATGASTKSASDRAAASSPATAGPTHWAPRPKTRKRFAIDPDARLRVVDEEGHGVAGFDVKVRTAERGRSQWFHGTHGAANLEFMLGFGDVTTFDLVVRSPGEYASTSEHSSGAKCEQLLNGKSTIVLHRGEPVQLRFRLPAGMVWPADVQPEVYFDDDSDFARMMSQPVNRRREFEEPNALGVRPAGPATFAFRLSRESAPFDVAIHSPGFLRSFERGPFTFADFKNGVLEITVEKPAMVDVHFDAGGRKPEALPFANFRIDVYRKRPGSNAITQVAGQNGGPLLQEMRLADLAAGEYAVMFRTMPKAGERSGKKFDPFAPNPAIFRDYKDVTLGAGQTKQVDLHYVPFDEHVFRGDRTAVVQIAKPDGKPAAGREVTIGYADVHYGEIPVFSGSVPSSGAITLKNITAKKLEGVRGGPYMVRLGFDQLGNFGFNTKDSAETFKFLVPPNTGDEAPEIEFIDVSTGKHRHLSEFRGRLVCLDFWATWCGPCQEAMRSLDELAARERERWKDRVAIIPLSIDNRPEQVRRHLADRGWTHLDHFWAEPVEDNGFNASAARAFVISAVPTSFLVGPDGRILWRGHPLQEFGGKKLSDRIEEALEPRLTGENPPVPPAKGPNDRTENKATDGVRPAERRIRGRVVDHQGQPCSDAEVLLLGDEHILVEGDRRTWFVLEKDKRDQPLPSATTDEKGQFQISPGDKRADRIAVISSNVLFWVVPLDAFATLDNVLIKLPAPGSLAVDFDLPQKPPKNELYIQTRPFDGSEREPDYLRFRGSSSSVENPGQKVFDHLPPARYSVEHMEFTPMGAHASLMTSCGRTLVSVEGGKQSRVRFKHDVGRALTGHVKGLENVPLRFAYVSIDYWGPKEGPSGQTLTAHDVISIKSDGQFVTDRLPPRTYELRLFAVRASTPEGSANSPDFEGKTSVKVTDQGPVGPVEIVATPRKPKVPKRKPTPFTASQEREALAALGNAGAQFRLDSGESAHGSVPSDNTAQVIVIVLGKSWKGGDGDLKKIIGLSSLQNVYVLGNGRVSDRGLDELRKARPDLEVERVSEAWLGVAAHSWEEKGGLHIDKVYRNSPAERVGMRTGDAMLEFAGKPVPDFATLQALMFPLQPGQKVDVKLFRGGKLFVVNVELSEWN